MAASMKTATNHGLSWQSLLFILPLIAANTVLQTPDATAGTPGRHVRSLLRSSPLYCLYDTVNILYQLISRTYATSLREALRDVAATYVHNREHASISPFRYLPLTASAVLGFFWLLTWNGLPWTQAFAAMYMISYCTRALLSLITSPPASDAFSLPAEKADSSTDTAETTTTTTSESSTSSTLPDWSWLYPQITLWVWCLSYFIPKTPVELFLSGTHPIWYKPLIMLLGLTIALIPVCVFATLSQTIVLLIGTIDIITIIAPSILFLYAIHYPLSKVYPNALTTLAEIFDVQIITLYISLGIPLIFSISYFQASIVGFFHLIPLFFNSLEAKYPALPLRDIVTPKMLHNYIQNCLRLAGGTLILAAVGAATYLAFRVLFIGKLGRFNPLNRSWVTNLTWVGAFTLVVNGVTAGLYYSQIYQAQSTSTRLGLGSQGV